MTKKGRRKRRKSRIKPRPLARLAKRWTGRVPLFWKVVIAVVGLPSIYVGILQSLPRIAVTPETNLFQYDPLSAPFTVSNDGYSTVHSAFLICEADLILDKNGTAIQNSVYGTYPLGDLAPNGRTTAICGKLFNSPEGFAKARLTLTIAYRPDLLPWRVTKQFHFFGMNGDNNVVRWFPM